MCACAFGVGGTQNARNHGSRLAVDRRHGLAFGQVDQAVEECFLDQLEVERQAAAIHLSVMTEDEQMRLLPSNLVYHALSEAGNGKFAN